MTDMKTKNLAVKAKNKMAKVYIIGALVFSAILVIALVVSKINLTS
jgi:hypothetical protein